MRVGFDVFASGEEDIQFRLFSSPKDNGTRPPLVTFDRDRQSGNAAVLLGHLCYQDEILLRLPHSVSQGCTSDAEVALAVYCYLGCPGLEQLEGEFSLVVWDSSLQRLFALRDPLGCWPLYWRVLGTEIAVSTSLRPLRERSPDTSLDLNFMAQFLMWPSQGVELPTERTPFNKIKRVLPGTTLTANSNGQVTSHCWWDWTSQLGSHENMTLEEAGEQYASLFKQAVKQRISRGRIAAHLSGGMDSSSVVCVARDWMLSGVGKAPMQTMTSVYKRPNLVGERAYAEMVSKQGGAVEAHFINADDALDFLWFNEELPYHDEPYAGLLRLGMEKLLIETAHRLGADTILTGLGSDELLAGKGFRIADLLRRGRWLAALNEAKRLAQTNNQSVWSILNRCGVEPAWPILMREGIEFFLRSGFGRWPKLGSFSTPPWVLPEFAHRYKMQNIGIENAHKLYGSPSELSADLWALQASVGDWSGWYLAAPRGMHNSHPFRDSRLLNFCLGLPRAVKEIPGMPKPVLQTAMQGVLPEAIRTRRDKRSFNDIYWLGLSKHLPQLEEMVRTSRISELGIFDGTQLIQAMRQAAVGIGDLPACSRINTTLALIAWFDQMMDTQNQPLEEPTEVHRLNQQVELKC